MIRLTRTEQMEVLTSGLSGQEVLGSPIFMYGHVLEQMVSQPQDFNSIPYTAC